MKPKLLIVDDDTEIRTQMKWALAAEYEVVLAEDRESAMDAFRNHRPAVVTLDLGLPPNPNSTDEGLAALSAILAEDKNAKVIIISGQGDKKNAVAAVAAGAYDFHCKPVDLDELKLILRRCHYVAELEREHAELQNARAVESFEGMLGGSAEMRGVFGLLRKVGPTTAPVLILGESGTGKELAAQAIHRQSPRKNAPFVAINCNAIPENLLESELFGHEKGAFTGAHSQRKGLVDSAVGGTLFLDEIGELPLPIQVKLLRFLQERTFQRVGGRQEIKIDTRVVAATNADLKQLIAEGKFREDLFYRLSVVSIVLPALRDRGSDLELLAKEFLGRFASQNSRKGMGFAPDTMNAINRHQWPGNIRELQNRVQRAVIMAAGKRITVADMELESAAEAVPRATLKEARESVEREYVTQALKRNTGNMTAAAAELGISRPTLYELMEKLGIPKD
ncbi:MAG: Transcriptional regulatory protein ZraR [Verrucomicrobiota bacterium]|jgi:two-component system NtrC family response regulator